MRVVQEVAGDMQSPSGDSGLGTVGSHCNIEQRRNVIYRIPPVAGRKQSRGETGLVG